MFFFFLQSILWDNCTQQSFTLFIRHILGTEKERRILGPQNDPILLDHTGNSQINFFLGAVEKSFTLIFMREGLIPPREDNSLSFTDLKIIFIFFNYKNRHPLIREKKREGRMRRERSSGLRRGLSLPAELAACSYEPAAYQAWQHFRNSHPQ